ncbi:MAG: cation:H+ antiporter [Candidatus Omnitrophota bacterium]|jgi:cation:H+ antiporter
MYLNAALLILGFIILVKGADILVDASVSIASRFGISEWIIGITIISFGSSLPELVVSLYASVHGSGGVSLSNVFGSNAANIFLAAGLTCLIIPIKAPKHILKFDVPICVSTTLIVGGLAVLNMNQDSAWVLSRVSGLILLCCGILYLLILCRIQKQKPHETQVNESDAKPFSSKTWLGILIGLFGLVIGPKLIVDSAVYIANEFKLSESFIAFTIIAIGTSLPEIVVTLRSAKKGKPTMALANVIGSNIMNACFVLGLSALSAPLIFESRIVADWMFASFASLTLALFLVLTPKSTLSRFHGVLFISTYILYLAIAAK